MPGMSGLETLSEMKEIKLAIPMIMITKSEEEYLMEEAIGSKIIGRVAEGKKMVLFFKDPLSSHPCEAYVNMLIRVSDVHNVPLAINEATAQLLLDELFN